MVAVVTIPLGHGDVVSRRYISVACGRGVALTRPSKVIIPGSRSEKEVHQERAESAMGVNGHGS